LLQVLKVSIDGLPLPLIAPLSAIPHKIAIHLLYYEYFAVKVNKE